MIYILDDEIYTCEIVSYLLTSAGLHNKFFTSPSEFWREMTIDIPELIILDVMIPEEDGLTIIRKLRSKEETCNIPVIMLSAKDQELDIVKGFDLGADDYVRKPFGSMELLARIKALLRRTETSRPEILTYEGITVEPAKYRTFVGGERVNLTNREFELLVYLIRNKETVLTRDKIYTDVWRAKSLNESRSVDFQIHNLRDKLGDAGTIITTIRGVGYYMGDNNKDE